tara:strand:+ start:479 stop:1033 length:555 start_codon:yes stop_codon:yes gene_type:complete
LKFIPQKISDVILIEPEIHIDDRGYFSETFRKDLLEEHVGYKVKFVQENESKSDKGVLRGLHYQLSPYAQAKLIRVTKGVVLDVVLDLRKNGPTFGQHVSIELSEENKRQLFVPRGFAHGFVVLSNSAIFSYKVDNYYSFKHDRGVAFNDQNLDIDWKLPFEDLKISRKDKNQPNLIDLKDYFE